MGRNILGHAVLIPSKAKFSSTAAKSVVIIGAGIVGMSAAYFLSQAGCSVRVIDSAVPASGATGSSDGAVSVASKKAGPLMTLAIAGARFYGELTEAGVLVDEFHPRATYVVASDAEELAVLERHGAQLAAAGVVIRMLTGGVLTQMLGQAAPAALAAIEVQGDGHAVGYRVVERFRRLGGFAIDRNVLVHGLHRNGERVEGVVTDGGTIPAEAVLIAAGGGSAAFLDASDIIRPRKGQLIVTERGGAGMPSFPGPLMSCRYLVSKGSQPGGAEDPARGFGLVIDPLRTGQFLIGGTREASADATSTDLGAVEQLLRDAVALSPALAQLRIIRVFAGVRAATRDGLPVVGALNPYDNVWIATGFEGDGICLGPLMGRVCQQLICGQTPDVDISSLNANRFVGRVAA
jgi:glycine/D-amino acid oxidase-like deaminating enzyme